MTLPFPEDAARSHPLTCKLCGVTSNEDPSVVHVEVGHPSKAWVARELELCEPCEVADLDKARQLVADLHESQRRSSRNLHPEENCVECGQPSCDCDRREPAGPPSPEERDRVAQAQRWSA